MASDVSCPFGFEEMIYDVWLGLMEVCFCQVGSSLDSVYGEGGCRGKAANSPYCRTREAESPVVRASINGYKYCGRRAGTNYLDAKRPVKDANGAYKCPIGTIPCGDQAIDQLQAALDNGLMENVICATSASLCPLTSISLVVNNIDSSLELTTSTQPNDLPLSNFKFSAGAPCVNYAQDPFTTEGSFRDEYTSSAFGCQNDDFLGASLDTSYKKVGTFTVK